MKKQTIPNSKDNATSVLTQVSSVPQCLPTQEELPQWQKDILDQRLKDLENEKKLRPIDELLDLLD